MGGGEVTCHERAVHGKALNPSMGETTPLIGGLGKVRYLDTSGPSMARRSTHPWERRHLLSTDWGPISQLYNFACAPAPERDSAATIPNTVFKSGRGCVFNTAYMILSILLIAALGSP